MQGASHVVGSQQGRCGDGWIVASTVNPRLFGFGAAVWVHRNNKVFGARLPSWLHSVDGNIKTGS